MALFMTARQAADRLGCSARQIRRLCERGQLPGLQGAGFGKWRISEEAVTDYIAAHTTSAETVQPTVTASAPTKQQEVRAPVSIDGWTLPADYVPVFPEAWGMTKEEAASRAAGSGRTARTRKAAVSSN